MISWKAEYLNRQDLFPAGSLFSLDKRDVIALIYVYEE